MSVLKIKSGNTWESVTVIKGDKGNTGDDGFSPVVEVEEITGGHTITITDAEGDHSFNVMDGSGYTETDPTVPSWAKASTKPTYTASEISGLLDMFYPVGSFYETTDDSFDPNTAWGGTWERESEGLVHIGSGSGYTAGATGGATASATSDHTLTTSQIPAHTHGSKSLVGTFQVRRGGTDGSTDVVGRPYTGIVSTDQTGSTVAASIATSSNQSHVRDVITINATHEHTSVGGGGSHNHGSVSTMQPYVVVNRWHRTA